MDYADELKLVKMDFQETSIKLLEELDDVKLKNAMIINRATYSIELCANLLTKFRRAVVSEGFDSVKSEVDFFKNIKQVPLVQLIYFSEIHSFEVQFPKADKKAQERFIKKKIKKINRFFWYNIDFGQYVNSGQTHFDREYYTRNSTKSHYITSSKFYFQDLDFCTPRDMLLGKFKAFDSLAIYLNERLFNVKHKNDEGKILNTFKKLPWPFTNTDWVELTYALSAAAKTKQIDLGIIEVSNRLQQIFDHQPQKPYKTYQDLKARKNSRTSFLDLLETTLISEMNKSDG